MRFAAALRLAALGCVLAALASIRAEHADAPCRTDVGACAQAGVPACDRDLGPWRVVRSQTSGLPATRSHSSCVLAAPLASAAERATPATAVGRRPVVAIVPQAAGTSGDTLLSRGTAPHGDRAHATVTLSIVEAIPDHWVFALAGSFLDAGARTACTGLDVRPPVNAGWALIGSNWTARPHGFYFERLADACVLDGTRAECPGEPAWIPHEFVAGETFVLDLALQRESATWWLAATVSLVADGGAVRELGRMRRSVPAPCWLAPDEATRALVLVIPDHQTARANTRVEVFDFAWRE